MSIPIIRDMDAISWFFCNLWYHIIWDMISPSIYRHTTCDMTLDHPKTPGKHNFNENRPPCCGLRFALAPCLCLPLALSPAWPFFVVFLLPIRWTHHVTDRTTSRHQPCPLTTRPATWVHDCVCFVFLFYFFPCLFFVLAIHMAWYRYRDIPKMSSILISIRTENMQISHDMPRNLDTIPNTWY